MKARHFVWILALLLAGCATYQPLPLDLHAHATRSPADIRVDPAVLRLFPRRQHPFDPRHGLDMTDVAILAVANNPQLKVARAERGIAHAQAFAAGLLPDPVLDLAHGVPTAGPSETSTSDLGLTYDVEAILAHPLVVRAAKASAQQLDLDVLWMEWQVAGKAQQLFVRDVYQAKMLALLHKEAETLTRQHAQLVQAGVVGDVSQATVAADLATLQAVEARVHDAERQYLKTRQALDAWLGLSPRATLHLTGPAAIQAPKDDDVSRALAALSRRRPDLLALQAGYRSADARYRQAILQQFPAIQVGFAKARDADGIYTRGFQVSLTLPLFNRNRGNIAVTKATREKLHVEYSLRLTQAQDQVEQILQDQKLLAKQRAQLEHAATSAGATVQRMQAVAVSGDVSDLELVKLQTNAWDRRLEWLTIDETMLEQQAALRTLLGEVPPANSAAK